MTKLILIVFLALLFVFNLETPQAFAQGVFPRPPQYVALAFDGCPALDRWDDTRAFAHQLQAENISLHFTYFLSSVFFLATKNKLLYTGPHHRPGQSDVGFGEGVNTIIPRVNEINAAFLEGHDIASHLNGHFDGSKWSTADWLQEFSVFDQLVFHALENNGLPATGAKWSLTPTDIVGFRTPYLATGPGLWPALKQNHVRYDTSDIQSTDYWPDHKKGFWSFPLARVHIAGTQKQTLSMDYNFYVTQSHAKDDLPHEDLFEEQMYETYIRYFLSNYNGNRAPVNIGHHFPLMNGGAYWKAMKRFATQVCGLPEVHCVGYKELADYMDTLSSAELEAYRAGHFARAQPLAIKTTLAEVKMLAPQDAFEERAMLGDLPEAHENEKVFPVEAGEGF